MITRLFAHISAGTLVASVLLVPTWQAIPAPAPGIVEVQDEPHHRVVFENAAIRLLDVEIPPQTSTLYHRHRRDNAAVALNDAELAVQPLGKPKSATQHSTAGAVVFSLSPEGGYVHSVINAGPTTCRAIDVELLASPGHLPLAANESVNASFENDRIRVYQVWLSPGETSLPLVLGRGVLMLTPGAAVDQVSANGRVDPIGADAPRWRWHEAGTYSLHNSSAERVLGVQLEIK